jgi:hypothetical protein
MNVKYFFATAAKRLHGYLICLTRGYMDGRMDSRAELKILCIG